MYRWKRILDKDPDNPKALNNLGVAMAKMGNFTEAFEFLRRAYQIAPKNRRIKENLQLIERYLAGSLKPKQKQLETDFKKYI